MLGPRHRRIHFDGNFAAEASIASESELICKIICLMYISRNEVEILTVKP